MGTAKPRLVEPVIFWSGGSVSLELVDHPVEVFVFVRVVG